MVYREAGYHGSAGSGKGASSVLKFQTIIEELNNIVEYCCKDSDVLDSLDQRKDFILSFMEKMDVLPSEQVELVLTTINDKVSDY